MSGTANVVVPPAPAAPKARKAAAASTPCGAAPQPAGKAAPATRGKAAPAPSAAPQPAKPAAQSDAPAAAPHAPKAGTKRAKVVSLLARPNGASAAEIKDAFRADDWTDRHVRECVAILKRAHGIAVVTREDGRMVIGKPGEQDAKLDGQGRP
jgi:hypothetical protein